MPLAHRRPSRRPAPARTNARACSGRGLNCYRWADGSGACAPYSHCGGRGFEYYPIHRNHPALEKSVEFALVRGKRSSPTKGQRGTCQYCDREMTAKCGRVKMWHWAHMPNYRCDPWLEAETQWHREWKELFPEDWREVVQCDDRTGEKHIADVKTPHGTVIEFQHSPMEYEELNSRESFYQDMFWVVDGDRGSNDPGSFSVGYSSKPIAFRPLVHLVKWWGQSRLLHRWSEASAPVLIDFGWMGIWRFLEWYPEENTGAFSPLQRKWIVDACKNGKAIPFASIPEENEQEYASRPRLTEIKFNKHGP